MAECPAASFTFVYLSSLRALGLLLADSALRVGWVKTFWQFFFYENGPTKKQGAKVFFSVMWVPKEGGEGESKNGTL